MYYAEKGPILVRRLVAEDRGKAELPDSTLSPGLWGAVSSSGLEGSSGS